MDTLIPFSALRRGDAPRAGGKGANLGELRAAGFPVPDGVVVPTEVYRSFLAASGLQAFIDDTLSGLDWADAAAVTRTASEIQWRFEAYPLPVELAHALVEAEAQLGGPLAVRSSATAEDLAGASFAGQHATLLNVRGPVALGHAVRACWASLWTERAIHYRRRAGIDQTSVAMAVVVQRLVPAELSGVLFTANPISGVREQMLVNVAPGLGEALVSGQITPGSLTVAAATGEVLEQSGEPLLSEAQVAALVALGRRVEAHFGGPQDIEWAIASGQLSLLQSRPITTIEPAPRLAYALTPPGLDDWNRTNEQPPRPYDRWTRTNVGENLPFPVTPLTETMLLDLYLPDQSVEERGRGMRRFYGRLYFNEGAMLHNLAEEWGIPAAMIERAWGSRERPASGGRLRPLRLLRRLGQAAWNRLRAPRRAHVTAAGFQAKIDGRVGSFDFAAATACDDRALWEVEIARWRGYGHEAFKDYLQLNIAAAMAFGGLEQIVKRWCPGVEVSSLLDGLEGVYSAEVGPALRAMARELRAAGLETLVLNEAPTDALALLRERPEAAAFREELDAFLQRHGHRCPNELELLNPRWAEAPEQVIQFVVNYLRADEAADESGAESARPEGLGEQVALSLGPLRRPAFRTLLTRARRAAAERDNSRYALIRVLLPLRRLYMLLGERWVARGWLERADAICFLTSDEIAEVVAFPPEEVDGERLREQVRERRMAYRHWFGVIAPDIIAADGMPQFAALAGATALAGLAASPGRVRGRARVVQDVAEAMALGQGDILVTRATDPGWTPVFPLVSGIVLEIGGQLSHGAIVAREYGVPAVVNVAGAMAAIRDGQWITVDGSTGQVLLEQDEVAHTDEPPALAVPA